MAKKRPAIIPNPDAETLQNATVAYLEAHDWSVVVIGGIQIRQQAEFKYELVIGFTGSKRTAPHLPISRRTLEGE